MSVIRIKTCNDQFEARILKARFNQVGIECFLTNELFTEMMPHYGRMMDSGVQVMIDEKDKAAALEILNEQETETIIKCPHCKSPNVASGPGRRWASRYMLLILSIIIFIPFPNLKNKCYCRDCGREF